MIKTTRHQRYLKAYTIIESLVVLVILTIFTMVLLALFKHQNEAPLKTRKATTAPRSAPADPSPSPTIEGKEE